MNKNVIDTGLVKFTLPFDRGAEEIYFNPNDVEFFIRISDMINSISGLYDDLAEQFENTTDNYEKLEILRNLNNKVKNAFDIAFGNNVSDTIFKYASPHAIIKNKKQYFSFYILEWLMGEIEKETGKTSEETATALKKAMSKHTAKYPEKFNK